MKNAEMKCVVLEDNAKFSLQYLPIPKPKSGELLIKVMAAPINPSDFMFIAGLYSSTKKKPCTPGFQGCGIVVENGGGMMGWSYINKKVAFFSDETHQTGSYSQYVVVKSSNVVSLDQSISFEHGSMSFVNPLTAIAMLSICKEKGHKTIIHTAAASALGRMMNRYFSAQGVNIINIVRRQEQVDILKKQGAKYVLNSSDEDFTSQLKKIATQMKVTLCFDAIGGQISGKILQNMPPFSTVQVYGGLARQNINNINLGDLLFNHKSVTGFFLPHWIASQGTFKMLTIMFKLNKLLKDQLKSNISKQFDLADFSEALQYYKQNMTKGKVIIKPWKKKNQENIELKSQKVENFQHKVSQAVDKVIREKKQNKQVHIGQPKSEKIEEAPLKVEVSEKKKEQIPIKEEESSKKQKIPTEQNSQKDKDQSKKQKIPREQQNSQKDKDQSKKQKIPTEQQNIQKDKDQSKKQEISTKQQQNIQKDKDQSKQEEKVQNKEQNKQEEKKLSKDEISQEPKQE